ncbi:protein AHNAK2 [Herpailurus yagouaroundi]|uniref:protein AHNAK2 n=1 Tax=Herpailurus yagouaroundi TaxID=1608482 RepID=UPI001AD62BBF|nr:protein AHNAK2 [Puma yagouaroundi]
MARRVQSCPGLPGLLQPGRAWGLRLPTRPSVPSVGAESWGRQGTHLETWQQDWKGGRGEAAPGGLGGSLKPRGRDLAQLRACEGAAHPSGGAPGRPEEEEARAWQRRRAVEGRDPGGQLQGAPAGTFTPGQAGRTSELVSGRQLQSEDPDAETEEDPSVTEGPVDEIVRPRPQGSSPVYECTAEGAGFGLPGEDTRRRRASSGSGGRRSWWKRDSGDARTFSRMSRRQSVQEATEVTLRTDVEAGASGYSVTGGGDRGIFVKQVLKDSSAAKLFSLREGDQLLSATIFFDNIKYEDALKILQYSEPYKVQFQVRRKRPAAGDEEGVSGGAQHGHKDSETQVRLGPTDRPAPGAEDKDVADGCTETPTKTVEGSGDKERLISKPREGRGRPSQNERLSWPKFQSIKTKPRSGPRRSHSSSEACEQGHPPDMSPTSTDTEAQLPTEEQEQKAGPDGQRRRRFLNLRFRVGSGKGPTPGARPSTEVQSGVLEEAASWDDGQEGAKASTDRTVEGPEGTSALTAQQPVEPGRPSEGALGDGASVAPRRRRKTKEVKDQVDSVSDGKPRMDSGPKPGGDGHREAVQGTETGIATSALQGKVDTQGRQPEFQIQIPDVKTPSFEFCEETMPDREAGTAARLQGPRHGGPTEEATGTKEQPDHRPGPQVAGKPAGPLTEREEGGGEGAEAGHGEAHAEDGDTHAQGRQERKTRFKFKTPSFGWSPGKDIKSGQEQDREIESTLTTLTAQTGARVKQSEREKTKSDTPELDSGATEAERQGVQTTQADFTLGEREVAARDSKFKMPKFKMPSFGASAPSKSLEAAVDTSLPKIQAKVSLPSMEADVKTRDVTVELPSGDLELKTSMVGEKVPEGPIPVVELHEPLVGTGVKGHLPEVQMPSMKMPKVDFKAPQVDIKGTKMDIKGPKVDLKGTKGGVSMPDVDVMLPSADVDVQAPTAKLEGYVTLGDKEVAARDSKFKMPKFKMPSFGASAPSKSLEAAVDVSVPKIQAEASLPSMEAEVNTSDVTIELPSADLELKTSTVGQKLPDVQVPERELQEPSAGAGFKGHLPKVHMPSIKMPKVDIKAPQVEIKGPKVDIKGPKGEVSTPDMDVTLPSVEMDVEAPNAKLEGDVTLGDKEVTARDSKFKMPKFKMPSFGASAPSKSLEAAVDVSLPKIQAEASLPSMEAEVKTRDVTVELPSADLEVKTAMVGMKLPEGQIPEGELQEPLAGAGVKGHLPKVHMPSMKMPKVDFKAPQVDIKGPKFDMKAPQVDIKGPKVDLKGLKGEVSVPDVDVTLPSADVDVQAPTAKLEGDVTLGDKEVTARDSKFKMPKFKMPSFGASAPNKSLEAAVDVSLPKIQAEVSLPSMEAEVKSSDVSVELPYADQELKTAIVADKLPEIEMPKGEPQEPSAGAGLKAHVPKVHMPSVKMPKVDFKAPQVDIKGPTLDVKTARGELSAPDMDVTLPSVDVDARSPRTKSDVEMSSRNLELFSKGSKLKVPKINISSSGLPSSKSSLVSPPVEGIAKDVDLSPSPGPMHPVVRARDEDAVTVKGDVGLSIGKDGSRSKSKKSHFKLPKVFSPPGKTPKVFLAFGGDVAMRSPPIESAHGGSPGLSSTSETSLPESRPGWLSGPRGDSSSLILGEDVTLTKYQVTIPRDPASPELPCVGLSGSQAESQLPSVAGAVDSPSSENILLSRPDGHSGPVHTVFPESYGRVTFPKFHRPKFQLSSPQSAAGMAEPGAAEGVPALSPPLPEWGPHSSAREATGFPLPGSQLPSAGVSVSTVAEGHVGTAGTSAVAGGEAPAGDAEPEGRGGPVRAPRVKLPSFRWSPKKGAESKAAPGAAPPPGVSLPPAAAGEDVSLGQEGEKGVVRAPALALLKVSPPTMTASTGGAGGSGGGGGAGAAAGPPEGADVTLHPTQAHAPGAGFVEDALGPAEAPPEASLSTRGPSLGDSSREHGLGDSSQSQLCGEVMAPSTEVPLQPSRTTPDAASPTEGSPAREAPAGVTPAGPRESWFRMPALRLPSFRRPSKEMPGSAGLGAQGPAPATSAPGEGQAPTAVRSQGVPVPESEEETTKCPQPLEAGADVGATGIEASHTDVPQRNLDPQAPAAGTSTPEVRVRPGAGSLPLRVCGTLAEPHGPPGEAGQRPLAGTAAAQGPAGGPEEPPPQPEGPLRLRASSTDVPSQGFVVNVGQVWEDSVLTVQFPKLKVPRFSFPAPSAEADVFVPRVRELPSPRSHPDTALLGQSPGARDAGVLKAPEAGSSEAAPICKVRVHIQSAEAESRQVTVQSTVTAVYTELSEPRALPARIVRESEVPASEAQTPSYGFSLLKGRVPEPTARSQAHAVTADPGPGGRLHQPAPGAGPVSGDPQPDTGEPFEILSPDGDVPGTPACSSDLHSGHGPADSCSDEEPAEILEFPPEEGREAAAALAEEDGAPRAKAEGKRSSGLFRFWLPSIGFSSSVAEASTDPQAEAPTPAPVQTQPEARPPYPQERAGWFRLPRLGFSSSPAKKSKSAEAEAGPAEQHLQEEAGTFFDARESFSPEEQEEGGSAEAAGSGAMVASAARTELILPEGDGAASRAPEPRPGSE